MCSPRGTLQLPARLTARGDRTELSCPAFHHRMAAVGIFLFLLLTAVRGHDPLPGASIKMDPNSVLVLWGTRHGNRHPENLLTENPRTWGFEGTSELTAFGKRQAYGLGRELRVFMGFDKVDKNYNRSQVKYFSSSASRCQMTLQVALAGFHEPVEWGDWNRHRHDFWSPIPYLIDDHLLRMYAVNDCPESKQVWSPIDHDTLDYLVERRNQTEEVRKYCGEQTHWNTTNLGTMADLADNLIEIDLYGAKYPSWIQNPSLPGYNFEKIRSEILSFAEIHQIACADYAPCGRLMGGVWLHHLLSALKSAKNGISPIVIGYASHTEVTLSVMKLMGIEKEELTTTAGFVLELRLQPEPSVRLLNHDPNPIDRHVIYRAKIVEELKLKQDADGFIPLTDFLSYIEPKAISDWKQACKLQSECAIGSSATFSRVLNPLFLLLLVKLSIR